MKPQSRTKHFAILIFGAPLSGKTFFAEQFRKRYNANYFDFSHLVETYNIQNKDIEKFLIGVLKNDQDLIIEGCLNTEADRNSIRSICRKAGYIPILIWVQTNPATLKRRAAKLKGDDQKQAHQAKMKNYQAPSVLERPVVISGRFSFELQCRVVLKALSRSLKIHDAN